MLLQFRFPSLLSKIWLPRRCYGIEILSCQLHWRTIHLPATLPRTPSTPCWLLLLRLEPELGHYVLGHYLISRPLMPMSRSRPLAHVEMSWQDWLVLQRHKIFLNFDKHCLWRAGQRYRARGTRAFGHLRTQGRAATERFSAQLRAPTGWDQSQGSIAINLVVYKLILVLHSVTFALIRNCTTSPGWAKYVGAKV